MPHTYPSPALRREQSRRSYGHPLPTGQSAGIPPPPVGSPNLSRYLTPNQQARILSWRSSTSTVPSPSPSMPTASAPGKIKSAPASLNLASCPRCTVISMCSCSVSERSQPSPSPKCAARGYYSNKKKRSAITAGGGGGTTVSTPGPLTPSSPLANPKGVPSPQQSHAHAIGSPAPKQFGQAPVGQIPEPIVAMPAKELPRIAGARDPISQNYYRQMFPPVPNPNPVITPSLFPPLAFGMPAARHW